MHFSELIMILGAFALAFGIVYISISSSHKQKMAMIEAGLNPKAEEVKRENNPARILRFAILLVMVPVGILVGRMAAPYFDLGLKHGSLIFAFLFGGLGLGIYFLIVNRGGMNLNDEE